MATVTPDDVRYADLIRGSNQRFVGDPEFVQLVDSTSQVVAVVQHAVDNGKRITVRSGGHCFEHFVYHPDVQIVVDMSNMNKVYFDAEHNAFAVESGATLMDVYDTLYKRWGVTVPAGICYSVGIGGHVPGGGWGMMSRQYGLVSDHLYGVEVVVVDERGQASAVVATREEDDPNRELWWAHTGGGGGNFGIVTRFWFRSPGASGRPDQLLPTPPVSMFLSAISWAWDELTEAEFATLVRNYGAWHVEHRGPDDPYRVLSSWLVLTSRNNGQVGLLTQMDATGPDARALLDRYNSEITRGVRVGQSEETEHGPMPDFAAPRELPWLQVTRFMSTMHQALTDPTFRNEYKSAYLRGNFTDAQIATLYRQLGRDDINPPIAFVQLTPSGGQTNAMATDATAASHRDTAFKAHWQAMWYDPAEDAAHIDWIREFYQEMFSETGGVPVPNGVTDGCYINYPDIDLGDPNYNQSTVPWQELYYKDNYPRLQQVKQRWDPRDIFRHDQSIRLPG